MSYRYTIQRRFNGDLHYQVGLADTIEHANLLCGDYRVAHVYDNFELRIYDYDEKKWIFPDFVAQLQVDKKWNPTI